MRVIVVAVTALVVVRVVVIVFVAIVTALVVVVFVAVVVCDHFGLAHNSFVWLIAFLA